MNPTTRIRIHRAGRFGMRHRGGQQREHVHVTFEATRDEQLRLFVLEHATDVAVHAVAPRFLNKGSDGRYPDELNEVVDKFGHGRIRRINYCLIFGPLRTLPAAARPNGVWVSALF